MSTLDDALSDLIEHQFCKAHQGPVWLTFPMASSPLSKKNMRPRKVNTTPKPDRPIPISASKQLTQCVLLILPVMHVPETAFHTLVEREILTFSVIQHRDASVLAVLRQLV